MCNLSSNCTRTTLSYVHSETSGTGKSVSEALTLESVNPQYDERLFNEFMNTNSQHVVYKNCFFAFVLTFKTIFVDNIHRKVTIWLQKLSFLNQLTHNMTSNDERLFIEFPEKYKFTTCCVQILF